MKIFARMMTFATVMAVGFTACAQQGPPPGGGGPGRGGRGGPGGNASANASAAVERLFALDTNGDGVLTVNEVNDVRLHPLLQRADANADGQVSRAELSATFTNATGNSGNQPQSGPPGGGPGGPPRPGQVLPEFLATQLQLSAEQMTQLNALQQEVDARLANILTAEQRQQLQNMSQRGPNGRRPQ